MICMNNIHLIHMRIVNAWRTCTSEVNIPSRTNKSIVRLQLENIKLSRKCCSHNAQPARGTERRDEKQIMAKQTKHL